MFANAADEDLLGYDAPQVAGRCGRSNGRLLLAPDRPSAGGKPPRRCWNSRPAVATTASAHVAPEASPFERGRAASLPDHDQRRGLERALEFPWDKWTVFLHPEQRRWVERDYSGPARVAGTAGTSKTIVALHRARVSDAVASRKARTLLTTFSDPLAHAPRPVERLIGNEPRLGERIDVHSLNAIGERLYRLHIGPPSLANRHTVAQLSGGVGGSRRTQVQPIVPADGVEDGW